MKDSAKMFLMFQVYKTLTPFQQVFYIWVERKEKSILAWGCHRGFMDYGQDSESTTSNGFPS